MRSSSSTTRCGFVLLAVLIITGSALLVATGLLYMTSADGAASVVQQRDAQSRALAWSGMQVLMQRLHEQRQLILAGGQPELDAQYEIYEAPNRVGVVRLLPIRGVESLVAEAGKLDLKVLKAQDLVATGLVETELAEAIVNYRDESSDRPIQSIAELLNVKGVTPELLYGPLDEMRVLPDPASGDDDVGERIESRLDQAPVKGLADVVTVYAFEPALQSDGVRRIGLDLDWSPELQSRCEDRFGPHAQQVQSLFQDDAIESDADLFGAIGRAGVPDEDRARVLNTFTGEAGDFRFGRLDINTASYETLVCLDGIEAAQAEQIIRVRDQLDDDERSTITWLTKQQIIDDEQLRAIADQITTRSFTWRVRLAAGEVDEANPDGPLLSPLLYEAVIDVSESRPRLAYLREITLLPTTVQLVVSGSLPVGSDTVDEVAGEGAPSYEDPPASLPEFDDDEEFAEAPSEFEDQSISPTTSEVKEEASTPSATTKQSGTRVGRWKRGEA